MSEGSEPRWVPPTPYFFLSHAHTGDRDTDAEVDRFFELICKHLRNLTTIHPDDSPGYLDRKVQIGRDWGAELWHAMSECGVFVPLICNRYFASEWCGWEWDAFQRREAAHREKADDVFSAIIPVLWSGVSERDLPACARALTYTDGRFGADYGQHGMYGLWHSGRKTTYRQAAYSIALTIRDAVEITRLRSCSPDLFENPKNAFEDAS
jgi:hypothetical protein